MELLLDIASYVFWVLVAITLLVFVHEMGHFLTAKLFGMRVERFSVGFPPKIVGKQIGETEYVIGATPLGGYVKISGMVDESMDTDMMESEPEPWEFRSKPVWQRIVVITAGVIFNVILAAFIFAGLKMTYGENYIPAENIEEVFVSEGSLAHQMGLRTGDRIVAVSGNPIERYNDILDIGALLADPMTLTVERGGKEQTFEGPDDIMTQLQRSEGSLGIHVEPTVVGAVVDDGAAAAVGILPADRIVAIDGEEVRFWNQMTERIQNVDADGQLSLRFERPDSLVGAQDASVALPPPVGRGVNGSIYEVSVAPQYNEDQERYMIGVGGATPEMLFHVFGVRHKDYGVGEAIVSGVEDTWSNSAAIVTSLKRVVSGRDNFRENVGGPVAIAKVTKEAADAGAPYFWRIVALLSITLAIMNILPIPALDGGHLMFLIYEGITRREPSLRVRMVMQQVGMVVLLLLMVFLVFNDILRF
ncbi:MAG: RIP metalloprotease RseP [Bacteroidota bacterium]